MDTETVGNVKNMLVNCAKDLEVVDYIYIIDNTGILKGVVSIRELLQSAADIQIDKMIEKTYYNQFFYRSRKNNLFGIRL